MSDTPPIRNDVQHDIEALIQPTCRLLVDILKTTSLSDRVGFAVMFFSFDGCESAYGSNVKREDMVKALRETADILESRQDWPSGPKADN